jgi:hypothetical protein
MLVKAMLVKTQARRVLARPRSTLSIVLVFVLVAWLAIAHNRGINQVYPFTGRGQPAVELPRDAGTKHFYTPIHPYVSKV